MIKKIALIILYSTSVLSGFAAASVKDSVDWWQVTKPFLAVWIISTFLALTLTYINQIRRITYPVLVCVCAWAYKHKIIMTRFTRSSHRVFKMQHYSYKRLFEYTQDMFDIYLSAINQ